MLRLASATIGPVSIAAGANGPAQVVEAYNAGDGALNLAVQSSQPSWAVPAVGAARPCTTTQAATLCIPITVSLNTASLGAGTQTAILTVSGDANTVDAPQTVTVTVAVGGAVPSSVNAYVPPNGSVDIPAPTNSNLSWKATTQDGNSWLSMTISGGGSFRFVYAWNVHIAAQPANVPGVYTGAMALSGSSFAGDNKTIPVTMTVTTLPIAQNPGPVTVRLAQGAPPMDATFPAASVTLNNLGLGTLTVTGVTTSIASCGNSWLTVAQTSTGAALKFDPTGQPVGTCAATLTFTTNAANTLAPVQVTMQVVAKGSPLINYQGVVDNATYTPGGTVSPGDIVVVKGEQFSFAAAANGYVSAGQVPLPTSLGGVSVSVNGQPAPLYYAFYGQIAFEMPWEIAPGTALVTVTSSSAVSNPASVPVATKAPGILLINGGPYGVITNATDGSFPFPVGTFPGVASHPVTAGNILTIWAIGLGPSTPAASDGQPPPYPPLAWLVVLPAVSFGTGGSLVPPVSTAPSFAGLSSQYPGLYQVNVTVPTGCPTGTVNVRLAFGDGTFSNAVPIAVQ
jgi:uncharacterized protein (TIGR03437 family)